MFSIFGGDFYGLYLQDQVHLPYDVHLLAGFRYDNATARFGTFGDPTGPISELADEAVTPRFGLLWQALPQLSLYGNYVENFGRSNLGGLDRDSNPLPPESAQQWEVGVKTESLDGRFTGTLAYYDLTKQNIRTPDPDPVLAAQGFSVAIGEVRNWGVEFDLSGEVLPGWRWIGSYSYIDSEITKDNAAGLQGNRLANVPAHGGSLWTTYEVQQGFWRDLTLGGGVVARSQVQGDNDNSFQIPGYAAVNLMAGYSWKAGPSKISLQLNIDNLLDKDYFSGSDSTPFVILYGAPRTFSGSVRVEF
ncbi:MAG: TonB-dependent siderophore receptor [Gammaproteobacteria bacterium]